MKKILTFIFMNAIVTLTMAQTFLSDLAVIEQSNHTGFRSGSFDCPEGTLFSKTDKTPEGAFFCQLGPGYFLATDSYVAAGAFSRFRFWGIDYQGCSLAPTESFNVFIWDGNPSLGGNLVFSQTLIGNTTPTGEIAFDSELYQIDIDLGTSINQLNGWIGITRNDASCDLFFGWAAYDIFQGGESYSYNGTWMATGSKLMFCLSAPPPPVPLSNRALYFGVLLMFIFVVVRCRRMI